MLLVLDPYTNLCHAPLKSIILSIIFTSSALTDSDRYMDVSAEQICARGNLL